MSGSGLENRASWTLPTYIVEPGRLALDRFVLAGDEGRHASRAARARPGELVRLIDGEGTEAAARVVGSGAGLELEIVERREHSRTEGVELVVGQALLKGRDFDEPVRRLAELGAALVVPLLTERVVPRVDPSALAERSDRWRAVAAAAVKQSRGVFLTAIGEPMPMEDFVETTSGAAARFVAWEEGGVDVRRVLGDVGPPDSVACVIGPEGGLSAGEVALLTEAGFTPVDLGRRILKADWAAAAAAAVVAHEVGGLLP